MPSDIAIIGAGYVGLPLAVAFAQAGQRVLCIDTDAAKVAAIAAGGSYISDVGDDVLAAAGRARACSRPATTTRPWPTRARS